MPNQRLQKFNQLVQYCPVNFFKKLELSFYSKRINVIVNVFDFNFFSPIGHNPPIIDRKGVTNALRTNYFLPVDELSSETRIQQMCSPVSRGAPHSKFFVFRSIPLHGLCSTDLSGESSRHRDMPAGRAAQALSRRDQEQSFSKHVGRCQRKTGLAHLRRLCSCVDRNGQRVVRGRELRAANHPGCLRSGFYYDRSVSVAFSMGLFSATQARPQTPYRDGSARFYSLRDAHHSWESSRCHLLGSIGPRTSRLLRHGPWIHRFRSPLSVHTKHGVFCDTSQKQPRLHPTILPLYRSRNRITKPSEYFAQGAQNLSTLSRSTSANQFLRYRKPSSPYLSDEQLYLASPDDCSALQTSMEVRVVLQMDQTKSSDQGVLRHFREHRENSNLDRHLCISVGGNYQEAAPNRANAQRNSPSFK